MIRLYFNTVNDLGKFVPESNVVLYISPINEQMVRSVVHRCRAMLHLNFQNLGSVYVRAWESVLSSLFFFHYS